MTQSINYESGIHMANDPLWANPSMPPAFSAFNLRAEK